MKKYLALALFIFLSQFVIGQFNSQFDHISISSQRKENSRDWLDAANQADTILFFNKETQGQEFVEYGKAFDINYYPGGYIEWTIMSINQNGIYELYSKSTCEINQGNGLVTFVYDSLRIGNVWFPSNKQELIYTEFDSLLFENFYEYDLQNGWQQTRSINYYYNEFNRCIESLELSFSQGVGLIPYLRRIHTYDDYNRRISSEIELYNIGSSEFIDLTLNQYAYEYLQPEFTDSISQCFSYSYNFILGLYAPSFRRQFFRNSQGKIETTTIDRWIEGSFPIELEPEGQEVFDYNANGDLILEVKKKVINGIYYDFFTSESLDYSIGEELNLSKTFYNYDSSSFSGSEFALMYADSIVFKSYLSTMNSNLMNSNELLLYPNPGDGNIRILNNNERFDHAEISSIDGRIVREIDLFTEDCCLNLGELKAGIYIIKFTGSKNQVSSIKFFKNE